MYALTFKIAKNTSLELNVESVARTTFYVFNFLFHPFEKEKKKKYIYIVIYCVLFSKLQMCVCGCVCVCIWETGNGKIKTKFFD